MIVTFGDLEHDGVNWNSLVSEANDEWFPSCDHLPQHHPKTVDITVWSVVCALIGGGGGGGK